MEVGDIVIGRFGAMIPEWKGVIEKIEVNAAGGNAVDIAWADGGMKYLMDFELRDDYYAPKGSPVGYYYMGKKV